MRSLLIRLLLNKEIKELEKLEAISDRQYKKLLDKKDMEMARWFLGIKTGTEKSLYLLKR